MKIQILIFYIFCYLASTSILAQVYTVPQNISGVINSYTKVTAVPTATTLTVTSASGFAAGNKVIIMQMQGASINTNPDSSIFGSITAINNTGNYEVATIASVAGSTVTLSSPLVKSYTPSGNVQLITLPQYNGGATVTDTLTAAAWNGTTGGVLALESCGTITLNANIDVSNKGFRPGITTNDGGALCFDDKFAYNNGDTVYDTIWTTGNVYITCATATSASPVWATVCAGAWRAPTNPGCGCYVTVTGCNNTVIYDSATYKVGKNLMCTGITGYYTNSYVVHGGQKAEGIALPIATLGFGTGAIANGGGGGNEQNGGGGGGGNYGAGGIGGMDYSNCWDFLPANQQKDSSARGRGGYGLAPYYASNRIFMGGGGGCSQENNNQNTPGTPGGGIVIVTANTLVNSATYKIAADGLDNNLILTNPLSGFVGHNVGAEGDGSGGAGAGGTVLLNVGTFTNPLTVEATGGRGANNYYDQDTTQCYAPGGGGGGGLVWFNSPSIPVGVTVNVNAGGAGNELIGSPTLGSAPRISSKRKCNNQDPRYGARAGINGGTLYNLTLSSSCTLPVTWTSFNVVPDETTIHIIWSTASQKNNALFTVEKSSDGMHWFAIDSVPGMASSVSIQQYSIIDHNPGSEIVYYRIKQTDNNGATSYTSVLSAELIGVNAFSIFPNPILSGRDPLYLMMSLTESTPVTIEITDISGKLIFSDTKTMESSSQIMVLPPGYLLHQGIYMVYLQTNLKMYVYKLVVE